VSGALVRARAGFRPDRAPEHVPLPRSPAEADVVDRFVEAFQRGDLDQVVLLLTEDAKLTMPPEPFECHGPHAIAEFLQSRGFWGPDLELVPTRANNQPALGYCFPGPCSSTSRAIGLIVLTLSQDQVSTITRLGDEGTLARFGLSRPLADDRAG
jgi:hypothetical protein